MSAGAGSSAALTDEDAEQFLSFMPLIPGAEPGGKFGAQLVPSEFAPEGLDGFSLGGPASGSGSGSASGSGSGSSVHRMSSAPTTYNEVKRALNRFIENLVNIHPELLDVFIKPGGVSAKGSKSLGSEQSVIPTGRNIAIVSAGRVSAPVRANVVQVSEHQIDYDAAYRYLMMYLNGLTPADIYRELNDQIMLADHEGKADRSASLKELLAIYGEERDWTPEKYTRARKARYAMMDFFADLRDKSADFRHKYLAFLRASLDALVKKAKRGGGGGGRRRGRKHRTMRMRRLRRRKTQRRVRR